MKRFVLLLGTLAILAGCADRSLLEPGLETAFPRLPVDADAGVRVSLLVGPWIDGAQEVAVWMETDEDRLGAYQARLRFDVAVLRFDRADWSDEGFRVLNEEGAASGQIRFAGFKAHGFADPEVLRVRFRTTRSIAQGDIELLLEAIGTLEGEAVDPALMSAQPGLYALPTRLR